jgi:hypothetical protein
VSELNQAWGRIHFSQLPLFPDRHRIF